MGAMGDRNYAAQGVRSELILDTSCLAGTNFTGAVGDRNYAAQGVRTSRTPIYRALL